MNKRKYYVRDNDFRYSKRYYPVIVNPANDQEVILDTHPCNTATQAEQIAKEFDVVEFFKHLEAKDVPAVAEQGVGYVAVD